MNQSVPAISVVVNNHNYASYLTEALDSVLPQLTPRDELVVVDDGSSDDSRRILQHYTDRHGVRIVLQENAGQLLTVFRGIETAQGDVIALLDSDDLLLPGYLERLRALYTAEPDIRFTFTRAEVFGQESPRKREMTADLAAMRLPPGRTGRLKWSAILFYEYSGSPTSGLALRRELAREMATLGGYFTGSVSHNALLSRLIATEQQRRHVTTVSADTAIVLLASALGHDKYYNDQTGFRYRIHGGNAYASMSMFARWYYRYRRKCYLRGIFRSVLGDPLKPTAAELGQEIDNRSWPLRPRRRTRLRLEYCRFIPFVRGGFADKARLLLAATGLRPFNRGSGAAE